MQQFLGDQDTQKYHYNTNLRSLGVIGLGSSFFAAFSKDAMVSATVALGIGGWIRLCVSTPLAVGCGRILFFNIHLINGLGEPGRRGLPEYVES